MTYLPLFVRRLFSSAALSNMSIHQIAASTTTQGNVNIEVHNLSTYFSRNFRVGLNDLKREAPLILYGLMTVCLLKQFK